MNTERPSPRYSNIDLWDPADILDAMIEGQLAAVAAVRAVRPALERAALATEARLKEGGRLIYAGAGTSGRLAVQDGAELIPTFSWPADRLVLLMAGGRDAMTQSVEGAEDEVDYARRLVQQHGIGPNDVLIAVAASGTTPFTLACLRGAKQCGALTVGIANNPDTPILNEADHPILLDTGAEPIAGSTRMNAGTAQRITLIALSSLVMILLGRVYDGLMVDLQAVNEKLVGRSERILVQLTGRGRDEARQALADASGNLKLAVLLLHGCDAAEAADILSRAGGRLRAALALIGKPAPGPRDLRYSGRVAAPAMGRDDPD
ncbi:MAG: N-acetylmuramic acid 6-phosphate etherase [Xanthobacteraceae bacterium]